MEPVYISVDCEFTDGDLEHGQLMQLAMVDIDIGSTWSAIIPITTRARVNDWVRENLSHLVGAALTTSIGASHLPRVQVGERTISGAYAGAAHSAYEWIRQRQLAALFDWKGVSDTTTDPAQLSDDFPAVLVTYCGGYDFGFVTRFFNLAGLPNPFHYEMVDISSLALGLCPELQWGFAAQHLEELLGMGPKPRAHDALTDARHQAEMFRRLMDAKSGALEALTQSGEKSAAEAALDDIAALCGCAEWDYPGQVTRDVRRLVDLLGDGHAIVAETSPGHTVWLELVEKYLNAKQEQK